MSSQYIETLIVGAGQAGLSTGYHLRRLDRSFLIVDGGERVGDNWRHQWDTLRLYTPAKYDGLPGMPFPGDKWAFPQKDEVADYLESYALRWDLPVRMCTRIDFLEARPEGGFTAAIGADTITCDNVVIATGTFGRTPHVPEFAAELDPSVLQLHSSEYRRPAQLRPGKVLVVGASHSGTDVAYEVAQTHDTVLAGRDPGQMPIRLESRKIKVVLPIMLFMARHVLTRRTPIGRKVMDEIRFHGGPMLRVKRGDLAERGVERVVVPCHRRLRRDAGARRRHSRRRCQRRVVHRVPAVLRLDQAAHPAGRRLARGVPRCRRRTPPDSSSAA